MVLWLSKLSTLSRHPGLKTEVERKAAMQIASQPPDPVDVIQHGGAKAWQLRPHIGAPKGGTGKQFRPMLKASLTSAALPGSSALDR